MSSFEIFGAPFDGTSSFRPGSRFAPQAIRTDFYGLETYSPYQDKDLGDVELGGDLELPMGDTAAALAMVEEHTAAILERGHRPAMLGGEHLLTLGVIRALHRWKYHNLRVLHFDAHADLRDEYLGVKLSHATVMRRCWELLGDGRIYQYGIRSGERDEFAWGAGRVLTQKFNFNGLGDTVALLGDEPVYLTLDLDVLEPSVLPGTGTPEPGGATFHELLAAILALKPLNIVGFDMMELSPHYDRSGVSTAVACKLLRELLLLFS